MNPKEEQFPKSLQGYKQRYMELPTNVSSVTLPGAGKSAWKDGVRTIDRSKDTGGLNHSAAGHNKMSTDLTNMRKSGAAAKYDAETAEKNAALSDSKSKKKTVKINSNPAKGK